MLYKLFVHVVMYINDICTYILIILICFFHCRLHFAGSIYNLAWILIINKIKSKLLNNN